jgi:hypothetical protein
MRYLHLKSDTVIGHYAGPQPGIVLEEDEIMIEVKEDDPRIINFNKEVL